MMGTKLFAVAGKPIMHSVSPIMHNAGFKALGIDAKYTRIAAESMDEALAVAKETEMAGINITAPFKERAFEIVDSVDENAKVTGAVNTIIIGKDGRTRGYNTDVDGVRGALENSGLKILGAKAVVLGAGGAAKAAVHALCEGGAKVTIANRTVLRAREIARRVGCGYCALEGNEIEKAMRSANIVVSTLATGARVVNPELLNGRTMTILDSNYAVETAISRDANAAGCKVISGKEWLLYQGYAAFELFTGERAPKEKMRKACIAAERKNTGHDASNIALVGFTGSGKTTVAKLIGKITGRKVLDTDEMIEKKIGMRVARIFEKYGEARFRKIESEMIEKVCQADGAIISVAGGALLNLKNAANVKKNCQIIWLWADADVIIRRISGDNTHPLILGGKAERKMKIAKLMEARFPTYAENAELVIGTGGKKPEKIAEKIIDEVIERASAQNSISGKINAPPSKSMMIRAVAAAVLAGGKTEITNPTYCDDAVAAMKCANEFGIKINASEEKLVLVGDNITMPNTLECGESALCMRLFAPIAALRGGKTTLVAEGTLARRDVGRVEKPLAQLGVRVKSKHGKPPLVVEGKLHGGIVEFDAHDSSQVLSGLLMALPTCKENSVVIVRNLKSKPYVKMTLELLKEFGIKVKTDKRLSRFEIRGGQRYTARKYAVEGDWSGAAFMLVAGAIAGKVEVGGLNAKSSQADRKIVDVLRKVGADVNVSDIGRNGRTIVCVEKNKLKPFDFDATDCPDLFPPLAALACYCDGTSRIIGAKRLAGKESDRAKTIAKELGKMGGRIEVKGNTMKIIGKPSAMIGGLVDSHGDHRVAMACAIAALGTKKGARIKGATCVAKSYPEFFNDLEKLMVKK